MASWTPGNRQKQSNKWTGVKKSLVKAEVRSEEARNLQTWKASRQWGINADVSWTRWTCRKQNVWRRLRAEEMIHPFRSDRMWLNYCTSLVFFEAGFKVLARWCMLRYKFLLIHGIQIPTVFRSYCGFMVPYGTCWTRPGMARFWQSVCKLITNHNRPKIRK